MEVVSIIQGDSQNLIFHNDLKVRKVYVLEVEARLVVKVDA